MPLLQLENAVNKLFDTSSELRAEVTLLRIEIAVIKTKIAFVSGLCGLGGSAFTLVVSHFWK